MNSLLSADSGRVGIFTVEHAMNRTSSKKLPIHIALDCGWPPGNLVTVIKVNVTGAIATKVSNYQVVYTGLGEGNFDALPVSNSTTRTISPPVVCR